MRFMKGVDGSVFIDLNREHPIPVGVHMGEVWQDVIVVKSGTMYSGVEYTFRPTQLPADLYAACVPLIDTELGSLCAELDDRLQASTAAFEMVRAFDRVKNIAKRAET